MRKSLIAIGIAIAAVLAGAGWTRNKLAQASGSTGRPKLHAERAVGMERPDGTVERRSGIRESGRRLCMSGAATASSDAEVDMSCGATASARPGVPALSERLVEVAHAPTATPTATSRRLPRQRRPIHRQRQRQQLQHRRRRQRHRGHPRYSLIRHPTSVTNLRMSR